MAGEGGSSDDGWVEAADDEFEASEAEGEVACLGLLDESNVEPLEEDDAWRDQTYALEQLAADVQLNVERDAALYADSTEVRSMLGECTRSKILQ